MNEDLDRIRELEVQLAVAWRDCDALKEKLAEAENRAGAWQVNAESRLDEYDKMLAERDAASAENVRLIKRGSEEELAKFAAWEERDAALKKVVELTDLLRRLNDKLDKVETALEKATGDRRINDITRRRD